MQSQPMSNPTITNLLLAFVWYKEKKRKEFTVSCFYEIRINQKAEDAYKVMENSLWAPDWPQKPQSLLCKIFT